MRRLEFTLWGFPAEMGIGFFASLCLCLIIDGDGGLVRCLVAAAWHELAHLYTMHCVGWPPCRVRFTPLGIRLLRQDRTPVSYASEIAVHLSGPAANMAAGIFLWFAGKAADLCCAACVAELYALAAINGWIGLFNLLPVCPLDGGQALQAGLNWTMTPRRAALISNGITGLVLLPLAAGVFFGLFRQQYNLSLLAAVLYLVIFFVRNTA